MTQHTPACHLCQEHCDCDRCKLNRAAPMLLEALERIASETCDHGPMPFCPREEARAAIRAARGEN